MYTERNLAVCIETLNTAVGHKPAPEEPCLALLASCLHAAVLNVRREAPRALHSHPHINKDPLVFGARRVRSCWRFGEEKSRDVSEVGTCPPVSVRLTTRMAEVVSGCDVALMWVREPVLKGGLSEMQVRATLQPRSGVAPQVTLLVFIWMCHHLCCVATLLCISQCVWAHGARAVVQVQQLPWQNTPAHQLTRFAVLLTMQPDVSDSNGRARQRDCPWFQASTHMWMGRWKVNGFSWQVPWRQGMTCARVAPGAI